MGVGTYAVGLAFSLAFSTLDDFLSLVSFVVEIIAAVNVIAGWRVCSGRCGSLNVMLTDLDCLNWCLDCLQSIKLVITTDHCTICAHRILQKAQWISAEIERPSVTNCCAAFTPCVFILDNLTLLLRYNNDPLSKAPNPQLLPGRRSVGSRCVCTWMG